MKPLVLTVQAFGSYLEPTTIDFQKLTNQHLFLISGQTGAGKTTIFDAMIFALYGEASGSLRQPKAMRSQLAKPGELTAVDFTFEVRGEQYQIHREPKQPSKDPNAKNDREQKVTLTTPKETISRITDAREKVESILGLTAQQFRQVVMLPQGEFQQLITADTKERRETFRHIFNTEDYRQFELTLKERYHEAKQQVAAVTETLQHEQELLTKKLPEQAQATFILAMSREKFQDAIRIGEDYQAEQEAAQLHQQKQIDQLEHEKASLITAVQLLEEAGRIQAEATQLEAQAEAMDQLANELHRYDQSRVLYQIYRQQQDKVHQLKDRKKKLVETEVALETLKKEQADFHEKEAAWQEKIEQLPILNQQLKRYEQALSDWEQYERLRVEMREQEGRYQALVEETTTQEQQLTDLTAKRIALRTQQQQLMEQLATVEDLGEQQLAYREKEQAWQRDQEQLITYQQLQESATTLNQQQQILQKQYEDAVDRQQQDEQLQQSQWLEELRVALTDGEPCPVCGSRHHNFTHMPVTASETIDPVQLQASKEKVEEIHQSLITCQLKYQQTKDTLSSLLPDDMTDGNQWEKALVQQKEALKKEAASLQQQHSAKKEWQEALAKVEQADADYQESLTTLQSQLAGNKGQVSVWMEQINQQQARIATQQTRLLFDHQAAVQQVLEETKQNIQTIERMQGTLERESAQLAQQESQLTSQLAERQQNVSAYQKELEQLTTDRKQEEQTLHIEAEEILILFESKRDWEVERQVLAAFQEKRQTHQIKQSQNQAAREKAQLTADLPTYRHQLEATNQQLKNKREHFTQTRAQVTLFSDGLERLKAATEAYEEQSQINQAVKQMYLVASGQVSQTTKVSFETYVLQHYFDGVIQRANHKLKQMTGGQYHFVREALNRERTSNKELGLDLAVFDAFTGQIRSVNTLSGGESFQASLAFALGLSEMIQEQAGAIEMGLLFIDEGFGSLDSESLQLAMEMFGQLESQGNRLIGIISHVEALKTELPVHLEVTKNDHGSHAQFSGLM